MSSSLKRLSLIFGFIALLFNAYPGLANNTTNFHARGIADGAGVWVNMWNYPIDTDSYCLKLYSNGIRNIFIQTSRSNTEAICNPEGLSKLIESAHRYQMRLIAWSFDELTNPATDAEKLIRAANFKSAHGEKVDAVAANLEKDLNPAKIQRLCGDIKQTLGESYPLIAVVYSPLNHAPVVATTPWPLLAQEFSVIAVMSYWNSKYIKTDAYSYTLSTVKKIRELSGRPDVDIHVIGDGMGTGSTSISQFLMACKSGAATSASLYPNQHVTGEQLSALSRYPDFFPLNGRLRLAAFRELSKKGKLTLPRNEDPSNAMQRGQFYQLVVRQFFSENFNTDPNDTLKAFNILSSAGIVPSSNNTEVNQILLANIPAKEAIDTIAKVVEIKKNQFNHSSQEKNYPTHTAHIKRTDRLFVQPAYAESAYRTKTLNGREINSLSADITPLSYFDAAQMVLLASGGLAK